jgi:tetratricopeptide (TPR) repeat protein
MFRRLILRQLLVLINLIGENSFALILHSNIETLKAQVVSQTDAKEPENVLRKYLKTYSESNNEDEKAEAALLAAIQYKKLGNYHDAESLLIEATKRFKKLNNKERYHTALSELASVYDDLGNIDEAIRLEEQALAYFKKTKTVSQ